MKIGYYPDIHPYYVFIEGSQTGFNTVRARVATFVTQSIKAGDPAEQPFADFVGRISDRLVKPNDLGGGLRQSLLHLGQAAVLIHAVRGSGKGSEKVLEGMDATAKDIIRVWGAASSEKVSSLDDVVSEVRRIIREKPKAQP